MTGDKDLSGERLHSLAQEPCVPLRPVAEIYEDEEK